jgi:hypothetical protein
MLLLAGSADLLFKVCGFWGGRPGEELQTWKAGLR